MVFGVAAVNACSILFICSYLGPMDCSSNKLWQFHHLGHPLFTVMISMGFQGVLGKFLFTVGASSSPFQVLLFETPSQAAGL